MIRKKKVVKKVAPKKKAVKKLSGEKHTDNKSHNYKINISGVSMYKELDNAIENVSYWNNKIEYYKKEIKKSFYTPADKKALRISLEIVKDKEKKAKRNLKEQKQLIKKLLK
jgi:hypothetical protein